jgi:hypothetical protein
MLDVISAIAQSQYEETNFTHAGRSVSLRSLEEAIEHGIELGETKNRLFLRLSKTLADIADDEPLLPQIMTEVLSVRRRIAEADCQVGYTDDFFGFWNAVADITYIPIHQARKTLDEYAASLSSEGKNHFMLGTGFLAMSILSRPVFDPLYLVSALLTVANYYGALEKYLHAEGIRGKLHDKGAMAPELAYLAKIKEDGSFSNQFKRGFSYANSLNRLYGHMYENDISFGRLIADENVIAEYENIMRLADDTRGFYIGMMSAYLTRPGSLPILLKMDRAVNYGKYDMTLTIGDTTFFTFDAVRRVGILSAADDTKNILIVPLRSRSGFHEYYQGLVQIASTNSGLVEVSSLPYSMIKQECRRILSIAYGALVER